MCDDARTVIDWAWGDLSLRVELDDAMTPEGIETMLHRTGREFTLRVRDIENRNLEAQAPGEDA